MAQSQEAQTSSERSRLPQTASPLPWIVLLGLTALGGFVALGRKRVTH
jgi:LPXTG-motif cell wall-anchored protein